MKRKKPIESVLLRGKAASGVVQTVGVVGSAHLEESADILAAQVKRASNPVFSDMADRFESARDAAQAADAVGEAGGIASDGAEIVEGVEMIVDQLSE